MRITYDSSNFLLDKIYAILATGAFRDPFRARDGEGDCINSAAPGSITPVSNPVAGGIGPSNAPPAPTTRNTPGTGGPPGDVVIAASTGIVTIISLYHKSFICQAAEGVGFEPTKSCDLAV